MVKCGRFETWKMDMTIFSSETSKEEASLEI
jgi:hypothetical protein